MGGNSALALRVLGWVAALVLAVLVIRAFEHGAYETGLADLLVWAVALSVPALIVFLLIVRPIVAWLRGEGSGGTKK